MRDAWSILDMCLGYAQEDDGGVSEALVLHVLGAADRESLFRFADALIGADAARALSLIDEMMRMGREVQVFARDVSAHLRALMLADVCGEEHAAELLDTTQEDAQAYIAQARRTSHTRLMRMLDLFLESESDMKWAAQPRFALEAAALRACAPEEELQLEALAARVDELERKLREGAVAVAPVAAVAPAIPAAQAAPATPVAPAAAATPAAPAVSTAQSAPAAPVPAGANPDGERIWQEALRRLKQNPRLFGMARFGRLASCEGTQFTVVFDKVSGGMYVRMLNMDDKNAQMAEALTAAAGYPCTFRAAIEGTVQESDKNVLAAQAQAEQQSQENLSKVFAAFGRENVRVLEDE